MAKTPATETSTGDAPSVEILVPGQADAKKAVDDASAEVKIGIENATADAKSVLDSATTSTKNAVNSATSAATKTVHMVSDEFEVASNELVSQVKTWIAEGDVRRLVIRTPDNKMVLEIPAVAGAVVGGLLILCAPFLALVGVIASLVSRVKVEVVRAEPSAPKT
jgi:hypothetical protein